MKRSGKGISASLLTMVMVLSIAVSMITPVVAAPVKPGQNAIAYLEPKDSTASYGNSQTIDVFVNSTVPIRSGKMTIVTSNNVCGNITGANWNNTFWDNGAANVFDGGNKTILGFAATSDKTAGIYNIGSFTVQCESTGSCSCELNFISETYVYNSSSSVTPVMDIDISTDCVENGTFTCTAEAAPINVDLRTDSITGNIFDVSDYTVNPGTVTDTDGSHTINNQTAMGAMMVYCRDNGINVDISTGMYGNWTVQIGSNASDMYNWMYVVDEVGPGYAADLYALSGGEKVHWYNYNLNYYAVLTALNTSLITAGDYLNATVTRKNTTGSYLLSGAEVFVSDTEYMPGTSAGTTGPDGNCTFQWSDPGQWYVYAVDPVHGSGIYNYPPVSFTCSAFTVKIDCGTICSDPTCRTTLPITLCGIEDYGSGTINVFYDSAIVDVVDVTGSADSTIDAWNKIANGHVRISAHNAAGVSGDTIFANVTFAPKGLPAQCSYLNLTVTTLYDTCYAPLPYVTDNCSICICESEPPYVTNPQADPVVILNDNGRARVPGTNVSQLSVHVTDDTGVSSVTVNLTSIRGPGHDTVAMTLISGTKKNGDWAVSTNASYDPGVDLIHCLNVNATDVHGNSNTGVCITLTVLRRGDVVRDNLVDMGDALYIARCTVGLEPTPDELVAGIVPTDSYNGVDMADALYIARYTVGLEPAP